MAERRPRIALVVGYFDWFSGYQETALATALAKVADVEVVASDRVNPTFSDEHLARLGLSRRYAVGSTSEGGVTVNRFHATELRSMVWSTGAAKHLASRRYELVVQVMPGQVFPVAASLASRRATRVALYGDNQAMWSHLPRWQRVSKGAAFALSKGVLYTVVNARARASYCYTPDTLRRLRPFRAGRPSLLMPLAFASEKFGFDPALRAAFRRELGVADEELVVLAAGKVDRSKRLDWLVTAFETVAQQRSDVRLVVVGVDGSPDSAALRDSVRRSPFAARISFLPFTDAVGLNGAFNGADLGVWPRNPAITIQQAMGTGLPVLLPRNDLVGHLVRTGTGTCIDLDDRCGAGRLSSGLVEVLGTTDFKEPARRDRAATNRWLSADVIAGQLLETRSGST